MKTYKINEIFYSLQGEGHNTGLPVIFVRFSGCNLKCEFCDTMETHEPENMTANEILGLVKELSKECKRIIFTGGEPLLQLDYELVTAFDKENYWMGLETNGMISPEPIMKFINYITVSPKLITNDYYIINPPEELRMVVKADDNIALFDQYSKIKARYKLLSPIFDGMKINQDNVNWAIKLCLENPKYSLSLQTHKLLNIR